MSEVTMDRWGGTSELRDSELPPLQFRPTVPFQPWGKES
jgi:hypothetical protein